MKTTKEKNTNSSNWSDLYKKVVKDITQQDSKRERVIKLELYERFQKTVKGKDFIIHNSCK